jgi:hypothetical protein
MQTTKRHPRTLNEAFGPYAGGPISEPYAPMDKADKIVIGGCIAVGIAFVALLCLGVI